jgi:heme/copper-type cytochrome/quinol oxidase subunit 1
VQFADFNMISSIGGFVFGLSQILFVVVIVKCIKGGAKAPDRVWVGAHGLDWTLPSPPPYHSFTQPPAPATIEGGRRKAEMAAPKQKLVEEQRRAAARTAAILGVLVVVFYIGFILSHF